MAYLKGSLFETAEKEGGVGGLLVCKKMFGTKHTIAMINYANIKLKVLSFPSCIVSSSGIYSYLPKTTPGISNPIMSEMLSIRVRSCVIPPLF